MTSFDEAGGASGEKPGEVSGALLDGTRRALLRRIAVAQAEQRVPSVVAAVTRGGRQVWSGARGRVDGHAPDDQVQYRIGSITKTFTAVLALRLREEGLLELGQPVERYVPDAGLGAEVTVRQLLAHTGGLAAEAPPPWWERTPGSLRPRLTDVLGAEPFRHEPGLLHHYSNPGFTVLGALVAAVRGSTWEEALRTEILEPLGLRRTGVRPEAPSACGWAVHPWADLLQEEKVEDLGIMAPAGQLWSTAADLARFADFLLHGDDEVLGIEGVRELRVPAAPGDGDSGYGLGTQLLHRGGRDLAGHTGSVPGFTAGLWICEKEDLGAVVLGNATSQLSSGTLAAELLELVAEAEPRIPEPWRPLPHVDRELLALTGLWYWGSDPVAVRLRAGGGLELGPVKGGRQSRFVPADDGSWVGLDGYYSGEVLSVVRGTKGEVSHLDLGSFVFTREPYAEGGPTPGGVVAKGWQGLPG
ncbi:serine hydrolase domain-containing protein [Streptomyces sp. NRRL F-5630]|uniref:serine hydrolase domain-containing protein n=1 Tax=Streptomyces sp. NRRL F-5630 TaxID=1463864 RepID=UPI003EBCB6C6